MSFTDEDLKRINGYLDTHPMQVPVYLEALLARLEAAEKVLNQTGTFWPIELDDDIQAWKKSKGE